MDGLVGKESEMYNWWLWKVETEKTFLENRKRRLKMPDNYMMIDGKRINISKETAGNLKNQMGQSEAKFAICECKWIYSKNPFRLIIPVDGKVQAFWFNGNSLSDKYNTVDEVANACEYTNVIKFNIKE
jgi:hypothetical protein